MSKKLIFVYNADDSFLSKASDFIHKIVKPETYQCSLCALTYGNTSIKKEWKYFLNHLDYEVDFYYKSSFLKDTTISDVPLPCILIQDADTSKVLVASAQLNSLSSLHELMGLLDATLASIVK